MVYLACLHIKNRFFDAAYLIAPQQAQVAQSVEQRTENPRP